MPLVSKCLRLSIYILVYRPYVENLLETVPLSIWEPLLQLYKMFFQIFGLVMVCGLVIPIRGSTSKNTWFWPRWRGSAVRTWHTVGFQVFSRRFLQNDRIGSEDSTA